jgi:hypothetical protein
MFIPEPFRRRVCGFSGGARFSGVLARLRVGRVRHPFARRPRLSGYARLVEFLQIATPKQEQLFLGGCLLMVWLINVASFSGYVILASFILIALARLAKNMCLALADKLPRRSRSRHYLATWASAAFFALLTVRACYIAAVIVDTEFRPDPSEIYNARK